MKEKKSFAEKNPKLNTLLGLVILIAACYSVFLIFQWLFEKFAILVSAVGKMDAVVITTIIAGAVSIAGVIISSIVGKRLEFKKARQEYLAQKREQPYGDFTEMVYKLMLHVKDGKYGQKEMVKDLSSFSRQITLWGSKSVVKKWVQFRKNATEPEGAMKNLVLIDEIMNEMRKDLGVKKVGEKELLSFFVNDTENIKTESKK